MPVAIRSYSPLAISRNRIVYLRRQGEREILAVTDLRGRRTQLDAFDGRKRWFGPFAVQGERVAWTADTKVASSILETRLPAPRRAG